MQLLYPVPASCPVTQTFNGHVAWAKAHPGIPYNGGIDYAAPQGTPAECAALGTGVRVRKDDTGYGWHVIVDHGNGYQTLYAHLSRIDVKVGQKLAAGDIVGLVGSTGNSTGPHLHFEVRKGGVPVDPQPLLSAAVVAPEPEPEKPAGTVVTVTSGWNLRSEPTGSIIGMTWRADTVKVIERRGDWIALELWIHKDGTK